ncbi:hypothetical protein IW261DRAFT_1421314 [Armillaria novae-zelandiae]|uniref:Uncharacterized protein n=1 Tax=Armillaria novae-zelandiae TaxID=153914 RepID=A0AA39P4F9_9AGAR|nr:hypothetical protein IW261DRAFT_1421314 [Armillaria novae-zelandiae]
MGNSIWGITAFAMIHTLAWVMGKIYSYISAFSKASTLARVMGKIYSYILAFTEASTLALVMRNFYSYTLAGAGSCTVGMQSDADVGTHVALLTGTACMAVLHIKKVCINIMGVLEGEVGTQRNTPGQRVQTRSR